MSRWKPFHIFSYLLVTALCFTYLNCKPRDPEYRDGADELLKRFSGTCRSYGDWTQRALEQTEALKGVLLSLQDNDNCKGIREIIEVVQNVSLEISRLSKDASVVSRLRAKERIHYLTTGLIKANQDGDQDLITALTQELLTEKLNFLSASGDFRLASGLRKNEQLVVGLTVISEYFKTLVSPENGLNACAQDNPFLPMQLATSAVAIAGSFINPAVGPAVVMAGQALSSIVDYVRREKLASMLFELESDRMDVAISCVMESMADTYCEAQDFLSIVELQGEHYDPQGEVAAFWQGLDLWTHKIPLFLSWIRRVVGGVEPADRYAANRHNDAWDDDRNLRKIRRSAIGFFAETEAILGDTPPENQERNIRSALEQITNLLFLGALGENQGIQNNPIRRFYPDSVLILYKLARDEDPPEDKDQRRDSKTIELKLGTGGFSTIVDRAGEIFDQVFDDVSKRLNMVVTIDPSRLVREAIHPTVLGKPSAYEVLIEFNEFLDQSELFFRNLRVPISGPTIKTIQETRLILEQIASALILSDGTRERDQQIIEDIFKELYLLESDSFISSRLFFHIQTDLYNRIDYGMMPKSVEEILRAAGRDAVRELTAPSQGGNINYVKQDLHSAMKISLGNARNFVDLFGRGIDASLKRLHTDPDRDSNRDNQVVRARTCVLLATILPVWPEGIDIFQCEGAVLESAYKEVEKLEFSQLLSSLETKTFQQRACTYRDYMRQGRLIHTRPPKLPGPPPVRLLGPSDIPILSRPKTAP